MLTKQQCKAVKKRLIDKDMTVTDLANEIGLTRVYVSNIINQLVSGSDAEEKVLQWYKDSKKKKGE
jgi:predicted DNA-binding protein YlxM (UPF0122 family)